MTDFKDLVELLVKSSAIKVISIRIFHPGDRKFITETTVNANIAYFYRMEGSMQPMNFRLD